MGHRIPNTASMVSLKVDNISYRTSGEDLRPLFEKYGDIGDIYIPRDRYKIAAICGLQRELAHGLVLRQRTRTAFFSMLLQFDLIWIIIIPLL